jgi:SAM-dependent methyltransferase
MTQLIRFDDGAAYDRSMGVWSRIAGERMLDWLDPAPGQAWIDVGCGGGAFTELVIGRCAPRQIHGVDPAPAQIGFAAARPGAQGASFRVGDAMALPFEDDRFDAAIMALVIFFVPEPARGVAEMARVVRPGGSVSAYAWDIDGGGFPFRHLQEALRELGITPQRPPRPDAARPEVLEALWRDAGLTDIAMRTIRVERRFADFDDFWFCCTGSGSLRATIAGLDADQVARAQQALKPMLPVAADGSITIGSHANAIRGRVPG